MQLKQIRKARNLTQEKLASLLGVPRSTLCMWETSRASPPISRILELSKVLNVSIDELLKKE